MSSLTQKADRKGRVTLFNDFAGQLVVIERISDDEVRIRKARVVPQGVSLAQLLAGVTKDNLHDEVNTDPAVGREVW